jgi:hypothetical protein
MPQQRSSKCKHGYVICSKCVVITDAAKRMSDYINLMLVAQPWEVIKTSWLAIRLEDGNCDGTLYDTREDAIKHQLHENLCAYFFMRTALGGVPQRDCQIFLDTHRHIYDNGGRLADPAAPQVVMSTYGHDVITGRVNPYAARN